MMEEPVQKPSERSMNLNSLVDQRISSSEKRERCIIRIEAAAMNSRAKSRSETESRELRVTAGKVEQLGHILPVDGEGGPGQGTGAERQDVDPLEAVLHPPLVPLEHLHVGEHVVGEEDRLGGLQVGVARHDDVEVALRLADERVDQQVEIGGDLDDLVPQVEADIQRHLVVAGAAGMEPLARLADLRGEARLDVHVDIFEGDGKVELAGLDLLQDLLAAHGRSPPHLPSG